MTILCSNVIAIKVLGMFQETVEKKTNVLNVRVNTQPKTVIRTLGMISSVLIVVENIHLVTGNVQYSVKLKVTDE